MLSTVNTNKKTPTDWGTVASEGRKKWSSKGRTPPRGTDRKGFLSRRHSIMRIVETSIKRWSRNSDKKPLRRWCWQTVSNPS
jgi:hypothetical protein